MPKRLLTALKLNREQIYVGGGLCVLLLVCVLALTLTLQARNEALKTLAEQRDRLGSLQARTRPDAGRRQQARTSAAPAVAFLDAPTSGLAIAQFQAYLSQIVAEQGAVLVSSGVPPADRDDKSDAIRLQITLNAALAAVQALLYRLEAGAPYVFVDALVMQPSGSGERATVDPPLKVNLTMHAFWRRSSA
jgi:general secretion pathway protein M